ncbi:hypothetical protein [Lentiprolixibacter aurantiacus]|uniref:Uncharacterized protein n=1 Tax=Lentiprolixibacter aurantiacus TaxID=2993939 RepID=A0AAE3MK56_9FLAO|nr:hypothetical protein [Lentiprolixibacter aurantiacus]MCX2718374.1 hypothetical protein [Lentiprolixibacter aurantiacus]
MYRAKIIHALLAIWLFAVIAPPLITLVNEDERVYISINQNEEEQEQGKKDNTEEKIVQESLEYASLLFFRTSRNFNSENTGEVLPCFLEIPLPPPEYKV